MFCTVQQAHISYDTKVYEEEEDDGEETVYADFPPLSPGPAAPSPPGRSIISSSFDKHFRQHSVYKAPFKSVFFLKSP